MSGYLYSTIPAAVRRSREIDAAAKLLFAEISPLCNLKGYCWAGNPYFAEIEGCSVRTIQGRIAALEKAGFIKTDIDRARQGQQRRIFILPKAMLPPEGYEGSCAPRMQDPAGGYERSCARISVRDQRDGEEEGADPSDPPAPDDPQHVEVIDKALPPNGTPGRYFDHDSGPYRAAKFFFDALAERNVPHVIDLLRRGKPDVIEAELQAWADEFRKLHDLDHLKWGAIRLILDYLLTVDDFWIAKGNLQTARKLRQKKDGVARWKTWLAAALDHRGRTKKQTGDGAAAGVDIDRMNGAFEAAA